VYPTYIISAHAIAYKNFVIIDRAVVITGSFNITTKEAAEEQNLKPLYGNSNQNCPVSGVHTNL
jgi:hypothetical protein